MNLIRKFLLIPSILLFTIVSGCSNVNGKDAQAIKAPYNNSLKIKGVWKIENINIIDNENDVLDFKNSELNISDKNISILNKIYINPKYKLKVVDKTYALSYEFNLKIGDIIEKEANFDVISIIDSNTIIGEFILIDDLNGYLFYDGLILKLIKENNIPKEIDINSNEVKSNELSEEYDSDVGVMLGLKSPRRLLEDGSYSNEEYKTLWISFKNDTLQPIFEKENIIFPRMRGIWSINSNVINSEGKHFEYFIVKALDGVEESKLFQEEVKNVYKNINFIGNDYIAIEKYEGDNFNNKFPIYQTLPIDNINSQNGLSIEEIYNVDFKEKYKQKFDEELAKLTNEEKTLLNTNIDYSNFTIKRVEGKWNLIGNISPIDYNNDEFGYRISTNPSKRVLNYDTLLISWRNLIGKFPLIKDAYTSPTGRISIMIFEDKISIYEMENKKIKGSSLIDIDLNNNEEVIMAEWASGSYVDLWSKAFKDGKEIIKED